MESKTSDSVFAMALRSFLLGGITRNEFLERIDEQLAAGAAPAELLEVLRRREIVEPLPDDVRRAIGDLIKNRAVAPANDAVIPEPEAKPVVPAEAATIVLGGDSDSDDYGNGYEEASTEGTTHRTSMVGDVLQNRFYLIELVGEGGMSRVYKAIDSNRNEPGTPDLYVAAKVLTRPFDEESESFPSLQQEVRKLQSLTHPSIVRLFDCDRDGSTVFIIMEYLVGESLYARLHTATPTGGPRLGLERNEAQAIIRAIANALDYAHQNLVVHGDLKPGNVIVTERGEVKVIDFGMSRWIPRPKTALERREAAQNKVGSEVTPRYASPQLMARNKPEPADDVYSLACLAYELLTGRHPYDDATGTYSLRAPPPREGLTPPQYDAVTHGLEFERRNRTPTVRQFIEEFTAPARRFGWKMAALGFGAAIILAAIGWYYIRPTPKIESPRVANLTQPSEIPMPVPASPPPPAAKPNPVIRDCPTCPPMAELPTGRFMQGSPSADSGASPFEKPQHEVVIDSPIAMSANDITVGDFRAFIAATGRDMRGCDTYDGEWRRQPKASWKHPGFAQTAKHPVTCTSWKDAAAYARWLSAKTGHRYRLPSAAEWEYAARAGGETVRPWDSGGSSACAAANVADQNAARRYPGWDVFACDDGYVNTSPVGSYQANAFGLNDMLGNVFQWTQDCWHDDYSGAPADGSARMDGDCRERELRGGSWFSSPPYVRASYRNHFAADYRTSSVGFRLVREISP